MLTGSEIVMIAGAMVFVVGIIIVVVAGHITSKAAKQPDGKYKVMPTSKLTFAGAGVMFTGVIIILSPIFYSFW
ncbi:MAG: hypothetical protein Faunusvirus22_5 [Faunusvirus sp.]|jgi:hypothetical protein|uniref:Uncharacterized protein n=1 Tax=Faunusvirus sp. TaxID=2487766 RepID=A0A3G4ZZ13_9VIRU|nr:MAG: hypothetical protein Faunusvirus22_5 [Faunusvirus sp.]